MYVWRTVEDGFRWFLCPSAMQLSGTNVTLLPFYTVRPLYALCAAQAHCHTDILSVAHTHTHILTPAAECHSHKLRSCTCTSAHKRVWYAKRDSMVQPGSSHRVRAGRFKGKKTPKKRVLWSMPPSSSFLWWCVWEKKKQERTWRSENILQSNAPL